MVSVAFDGLGKPHECMHAMAGLGVKESYTFGNLSVDSCLFLFLNKWYSSISLNDQFSVVFFIFVEYYNYFISSPFLSCSTFYTGNEKCGCIREDCS